VRKGENSSKAAQARQPSPDPDTHNLATANAPVATRFVREVRLVIEKKGRGQPGLHTREMRMEQRKENSNEGDKVRDSL